MTYDFFYDSATLFLASLIAGVCIGAVRTVQTFLRKAVFAEKTVFAGTLWFFGDIGYCLFFTIAFLAVTYSFNDGGIRIFALLSALSGVLLFTLTVGRLIRPASDRAAGYICRSLYGFFGRIKTFCGKSFGKVKEKYEKKRKFVFKDRRRRAADSKHGNAHSKPNTDKHSERAEGTARRNGYRAERADRRDKI